MKKTWCIGCINAEFIAKMEQILWLYQQEYDPLYPVVCFDERPCFLIGNKVEPIALQSGQVAKEHYGYEKNEIAQIPVLRYMRKEYEQIKIDG